ncbi:MAG: FtsX-like permease family protein, partial [bacterium]
GVKRAGFASDLPLTGDEGCSAVTMDTPTEEKTQCMPLTIVSPGYFETMGIPVSGALPTWSSVQSLDGPIVVSKGFAKRFWPGENAVGHTVQPLMSERMQAHPVVGVAGDVRADGIQKPPTEVAYLPLIGRGGATEWNTQMTLVVRAPSVDARTLMPAIHQIVRQIDPQVPIADTGSLEVVVARSMAQLSFTMLLLIVSAVIALSLSAVGIYGVIAYIVAQRRPEIGIRMALGAQAAEVARLVVTQSVALAGFGILVGVAAALAGTRLLTSLLFEVKPTDPVALVSTCAVLVIVAALASAGPARRAAKVDPAEALRQS